MNTWREVTKSNLTLSAIIDIKPKTKTIIQKSTHKDFIVDIIKLSTKDFNMEIFKYRRYLKSLSDPSERVAHFETLNANGVYSLSKHDKVFNSRLRPGEGFERV